MPVPIIDPHGPTDTPLSEALHDAYAAGCAAAGDGAVANYIPELARADPGHFGLAVSSLDGAVTAHGDVDVPFTLQSVSKVFSLSAVACDRGLRCLDNVSVEPSGDAFHSIVLLEDEQGRPRNPFINAGAIAISERLPGGTSGDKIAGFRRWLQGIDPDRDFAVDAAVWDSECDTGFRNRALANYVRHFGVVEDPQLACDTYFKQCAIQTDARGLARLGLYLANRGRDPLSGRQVIDPGINSTLLALMTTCGLYDEVGHWAVEVGLPAKSGVSGGLLAVVPGRYSIAAYGPALGPKGNSAGGMAALRSLSRMLGLSLFA